MERIGLRGTAKIFGDRAPLADFHDLAQECDGFLVVDEAHATGVWGPQGRGFSAGIAGNERVITLHTCGKALGVQGALICAAAPVRPRADDAGDNRARLRQYPVYGRGGLRHAGSFRS